MKCLQRLNPQLFEKCVYNVLPRNSLKSVYRRFFYQLRYLTSIYFCLPTLNFIELNGTVYVLYQPKMKTLHLNCLQYICKMKQASKANENVSE